MRVFGRVSAAALTVTAVSACAPPPESGSAFGASDPTAASSDAGGSEDTGEHSSGAALPALDMAKIDRSSDEGPCGYPSEGPNGYGTAVGERLENSAGFSLVDCDGNTIELADFFCPRSGEADFNRGILINIGAGWCGPCQEETLEFPELYEEFHDQGIEIVQVLFQDWSAQAPSKGFCEDWRTGQWSGDVVDAGVSLPFPVALDQVFDWTSVYLQDPQSATPVNMLVDANGNIRWKSEGQKVPLQTLRTQFNQVLQDPYGTH